MLWTVCMTLFNTVSAPKTLIIPVISRGSKLALVQVQEVLTGLKYHHPEIEFSLRCLATKGDKDQKTSLKDLESTDFFTDQLDQHLLEKKARIAIHSAKDLPEQLPKGLKVIALTACRNNQDTLVLRKQLNLKKLKKPLKVGVSSLRREEGLKQLFKHLQFHDIRGTIDQRLSLLNKGTLDAVVIAKVALMRLGYTHLNQMDLDIDTPSLQGSLAVVAREDDIEMARIFSSIESRADEKILYFGLDPSHYLSRGRVTHCPLIQTESKPLKQNDWLEFISSTDVLFTSQKAVKYFADQLKHFPKLMDLMNQKRLSVVGEQTRLCAIRQGWKVHYVARNESQEGLIELFSKRAQSIKKASFFYPKSSSARTKLALFLKQFAFSFHACDLYQTLEKHALSKGLLEQYDEIVFTSPSCVKSFFGQVDYLPKHLRVKYKGEVTREAFEAYISR